MNLSRFALRNQVFVLCVVLGLFAAGTLKFLTMSRREDPEIYIRTAVVTTQWPGATASKVENLVTDPIETAIKRMDGVDEIRSESRNGQSILYVDIDENTPGPAVDQYWDELRVNVSSAESKLPDGCRKPVVNSDFGDVYDVVYAIYQEPATHADAREYSYRDLEVFAESVKDELKNLPTVGRVDLFGIQDERVYLEVDAADWAKLQLGVSDLAKLLDARNIVASGGQIDTTSSRFNVKPTGEFTSVGQIEDVVVAMTEDQVPIRLGDLPVQVVRDYVDPPQPHVLHATPELSLDHCLLVGVALKSGQNVVKMGESVTARVQALRASTLPPDLQLVRINNLPIQVDTLVQDFVTNLWQAIVLVLVVAFFMMGWRPAIVMALAIPICMIISIFIVSLMGVELEQFSIASLIIALGMLVDNAIVVSDNVLRELEDRKIRKRGKDKRDAAEHGAWSLATPILTSTLTTVAAFLPMLTMSGSSGEYVRSLPIVVSVTLLTSYAVAMMVTPILCVWLLKPKLRVSEPHVGFFGRLGMGLRSLFGKSPRPSASQPDLTKATGEDVADPNAPRGFGAVYDAAVRWCLRHKFLTIGAAGAAVVASMMLMPLIGTEFFPGGVRNQIWVHLWMPEGSSIHATSSKAQAILEILQEESEIEVEGERVERLRTATAFVGMGGPRLNLVSSPEQQLPNYAMVLVTTHDPNLSAGYADDIRKRTDQLVGTRIDVRPFKLGPYIKNPVEFRISGPDHALLRAKAEEIVDLLRDTKGTYNPFHNWFNDGFVYDVQIDSEQANLAGVSNKSVADTMDALISGGYLTTYREGDHQVPVVLRINREQRTHLLDRISDVYVDGQYEKIPLESIATVATGWEPACIQRLNTIPTVSVGCQAQAGILANTLAARVQPKVEAVVAELPKSYKLEVGGELEETQESQGKTASAFQISALLILLVLIAQYNSIAKPLVVLSTVPLALIGALLGLYLTGWAMGFMPTLGIISLAGVVINNAIILIDFIQGNVRAGQGMDDAIATAGRLRMRPILLTTLTTIGGLLPLALLAGPMWAGMAWAMIFGLALSTGLTLLVVPTIFAACVNADKLRSH